VGQSWLEKAESLGIHRSTKHTLPQLKQFTLQRSNKMAFRRILNVCAVSVALVSVAAAHGGGAAHQKPLEVDPEANWATRHMAGTTLPLCYSIPI